jgi:hypothetical protein
VSNPTEIKVLLDSEPLNGTMAVHQSFFNYVSGTYQSQGPSDPIVGYHDIGRLGYSDALGADLIRNSWGTSWGTGCMVNGINRPGYCWIAYGELDAEAQQLVLDGPVPPPGPTPVSCTVDSDCPVGYVCVNGVCVPGPVPPPLPSPTASFNPTRGRVGTTVSVAGSLWAQSETITSVVVGNRIARNALAVVSAVLSGNIVIPRPLRAGTYDIVITGSLSGAVTFPKAFTVIRKCFCEITKKGGATR